MGTSFDSGEGNGTEEDPQQSVEESEYDEKEAQNEASSNQSPPPIYKPSPKHGKTSRQTKRGTASANPIRTQEEGQHLLDTGYHEGRQVYNITDDGRFVKFQPDGTPQNGYHSYELRDGDNSAIPPSVLKEMKADGVITNAQYNKLRKNRGKGKNGKKH